MPEKDIGKNLRAKSPWRQAVGRFSKNRGAVLSLVVLAIIVIACAGAAFIISPEAMNVDLKTSDTAPSFEHLFGTDTLGRDVLARVLYGGRITLSIAFRAVLMSLVGLLLGVAAGFCGGKLDAVISRVNDGLASIPMFLLAVFVECAIGWGEGNFVYAIALSFVPPLIRLSRSIVVNIMGSEYIEAARALGVSSGGIIRRHILRNIAAPVAVHITVSLAEAVLMCTLLGYLGIGINPPTPEWGTIVSDSYPRMNTSAHMVLLPCAVIITCVFALNIIGNGIHDAFAPESGEV